MWNYISHFDNSLCSLYFQSIYKLKGKDGGPEKAEQTAMNIFIQMDRNKDDKLTQAEFLTGAKHSKSIMNLLQASGGGTGGGSSPSNTLSS